MYCGTSGLRDFMYADIMEMAQFSVIMFSFATILRTFVMIYILDPLSEIMVRPERVLKFQQSAWRFVLYSIATISSIIVFMTDDTVDFKESSFLRTGHCIIQEAVSSSCMHYTPGFIFTKPSTFLETNDLMILMNMYFIMQLH
ncbi:Longevity-assurance (LAG1) family protein [Emiliania huxleyi virus 164]|nr:Longevity-assurance (LAG1) family protein [Emiliania huxleyi virus 164]